MYWRCIDEIDLVMSPTSINHVTQLNSQNDWCVDKLISISCYSINWSFAVVRNVEAIVNGDRRRFLAIYSNIRQWKQYLLYWPWCGLKPGFMGQHTEVPFRRLTWYPYYCRRHLFWFSFFAMFCIYNGAPLRTSTDILLRQYRRKWKLNIFRE